MIYLQKKKKKQNGKSKHVWVSLHAKGLKSLILPDHIERCRALMQATRQIRGKRCLCYSS